MPSIRIVTNKPVAFDSPDHVYPTGTARDNYANLAFNTKLSWWLSTPRLRVLDLGCAGGSFVKSILDQGGFAVGIEGSDYSRVRKRAEWATIPEHLFTADITEPFQLLWTDESGREEPLQFNVVTLWEVMEHIHESKLYDVCENISRHLSPHGLVIMSISPKEEVIEGVRLHQTVQNKGWWIAKFSEFGFVHYEQVLTFFGSDWVRGGDWGSFHLVMTRRGQSLPFENKFRLLMLLVPPLDHARRIRRTLRRMLSRTLH